MMRGIDCAYKWEKIFLSSNPKTVSNFMDYTQLLCDNQSKSFNWETQLKVCQGTLSFYYLPL